MSNPLKMQVSRILLLPATLLVTMGFASAADQQITYSKDIAPILQRSCQRCHRPDSVAPMSLLTYKEARPFAREIKRRTALRYAPWSRDAMPPWFLETNIGIQHMKDDISLSDKEIAMIGKWADSGAPEGNPADLPKALVFADSSEWTLGKPDLIVSTPTVYIGSVASDWGGNLGKTALGLTEDRYASSAEFKEWNDFKAKGATIGGRFVFHHANVGIAGPGEEGDVDATEGSGGGARLPIHEVGRNGDVFPPNAGVLLPAGGSITWDSMHIHAAGSPGSERNARLDIGLRLHPVGYKPDADIRAYTFGRTEIQVDAGVTNHREDAYFVAPSAMKLINFEPHLHANGVRMCLEAVYGRVVETLNCSGYDHNWVRNYQYEENSMPLIPKGTILHAVAWMDNTVKNGNTIDPRNTATFGNSSVSNMFIMFNLAQFLTPEQYRNEVQKRKEYIAFKDYLTLTSEEMIGCPACYLPAAPAPKGVVAATPENAAPKATVVAAN
jgi:hypothetical protein